MNQIKMGCCGLPKGMKRHFSHFKLVEVQQAFYRPPSLDTALKWRREGEGNSLPMSSTFHRK